MFLAPFMIPWNVEDIMPPPIPPPVPLMVISPPLIVNVICAREFHVFFALPCISSVLSADSHSSSLCFHMVKSVITVW